MIRLLPILPLLFTASLSRGGDVAVSDRAGLVAALRGAVAGTVIRVAPGRYAGGLSASGLAGTKERPVIITAADATKPPVIEGGSSGIQLSGCSWVVLSDVHFTGAAENGINIDDGGSGKPASVGMVMRRLKITNTAPRGNRDGIKLSGLEDFRVEECEVVRWGAGGSGVDMVGCHRGVVEGCRFEHDGGESSNGVQMKGGTEAVTVRRCFFLKPGGRGVNLGGSTGEAYFRPLGAKFEARNLTVEDCVFVEAQAAVAFVGVDGAVVQHCTVIRPGRWALRILQENQGPGMARCRQGVFRRNLVVFAAAGFGGAVNVGPDTQPETFTYEGNAWYCTDEPASTRRVLRLPAAEKDGRYDAAPKFTAPEAGDFSQTADSPLRDAGVRKQVP